MDNEQIEARVEIEALLESVEDLNDEVSLKKAEIKVAKRKLERLAKRFPELARSLGVTKDEESEGEAEAPKKRGRPAA
jgi:peptidoglycan hydrolase CwlO-like protein